MPASHRESHREADVLKQFRVIFQSVRKHFQSVEALCGVSGSQLWALAKVVEAPGLRVTELAKAMTIHQSTASNLVEGLVQLGLIRRQRGELDQRVVLLYPTEAGEQLYRKAPQPIRGVLPDALSRLDPTRLAGLAQHLNELIDLMGDHIDPRGGNIPLADIAAQPAAETAAKPPKAPRSKTAHSAGGDDAVA
ncbi:MarR family winged helix-turn-helix transcriptional regulator [Chitinimonas sp. BJYL2]|uniref:MarR family winged helix-turn-helix transcriptional regulator n=1 Tax=Chitinimonas sp. BJYL2 TaxID=2976696 RepID=UPI0022B566D5|nr:MarR family transcriptional regulator [Chitinimonas sp. BJYL2]